jgi:uncharacterized phage protein gp47/JayE
MPTYIPVPVETDPPDLAALAFDYLQTRVPGWLPSPGNLEAWLTESLALVASELRILLQRVPDSIFAYLGASILGLPPQPAIRAAASTTWQMVDTAGYTVNAGTVIAITPPASATSYTFTVDSAFTIAAGQTSKTGVVCHALTPGAASSGLSGTVTVIDALNFVNQVTLETPTSGGQDAETSAAYLNRLSALLTLLSPRGILPQDFAILAQRMIPGVARALAIDLYDPTTGMTNRPRCVTVVPVDSGGNAVSSQTKTDIDALLQGMREVNFLVYVADPVYTQIDVTYDVQCYPSYDATDVNTRTAAALTKYLQPYNWGLPPFGDTSVLSWINEPKVRYLELTEQANRVDGVRYVNSLVFGIHTQPLGTVDITLPGAAPLTRPSTISGQARPPLV